MYIQKLKLYNFRNIEYKEYNFTKKINIFFGDNGVGKTSILEAIHFLSTGKSFRKSTFKSIIKFQQQELAVYLETKQNIFSVSKSIKGTWKGKQNNSSIKKQSIITNQLPVVSIDPEVYRLVDFGPIFRRNFLDWLVFHVKHDYLLLWKKTYKCIKQLNILYKQKAPSSEINVWENNFIDFSEELSKTREEFFNQITPTIFKLSHFMQEEIKDLTIEFKKGWSGSLSLREQLKKDRKRNLMYGKLQYGPQKMDIVIKTSSNPAAQILSRGQKKVLSISFYMAYIQFLIDNDIEPIVCLDDFDAELDKDKLAKAAEFFNKINSQIFITSVQKKKIGKVFPGAAMFHVEP